MATCARQSTVSSLVRWAASRPRAHSSVNTSSSVVVRARDRQTFATPFVHARSTAAGFARRFSKGNGADRAEQALERPRVHEFLLRTVEQTQPFSSVDPRRAIDLRSPLLCASHHRHHERCNGRTGGPSRFSIDLQGAIMECGTCTRRSRICNGEHAMLSNLLSRRRVFLARNESSGIAANTGSPYCLRWARFCMSRSRNPTRGFRT